ncbi:unnamed protein product [Sphagnum balticum]
MHLVGAGVIDMGIVGILPEKAGSKGVKVPQDELVALYKSTEFAEPGYYRVDIENNITRCLSGSVRVLGGFGGRFGGFEWTAISESHQTKLDTALYRTMLTPTLFNDWNGEYMSFRNDGSTSRVPADMEAVYTDMSLWDVHRTQMPWLLFQDPHRFRDIAKSLLLFNRDGGYMPKWPFAMGWTGCMTGAHATTVLADWLVKEAHESRLVDSE